MQRAPRTPGSPLLAEGLEPGSIEPPPPGGAPGPRSLRALEARVLAFEPALDEARPDLLAQARRLVAGRRGLDAEDLVQDALARALRFRERYDPARPLLPWLRQVLLRRFLDELRRLRATPVRPAEGHADADHAPPLEPHDPGPDASELAARRDLVESVLARLDEPERGLLDRFHRGGRTIAELAAEYGMPAGTIKSHLHRARKRLAHELRDAEETR